MGKTSYALGIEFDIQDKATEKLSTATNLLKSIEDKVLNLFSNMSNKLSFASENVEESVKKMKKLEFAADHVKDKVIGITKSTKDWGVELDKKSKELNELAAEKYRWAPELQRDLDSLKGFRLTGLDEDSKEIAEVYHHLGNINDKYKDYLDLVEQARGKEGVVRYQSYEKISDTITNFNKKIKQMDQDVQKARQKFFDENEKGFQTELRSKKELEKLSEKDLQLYDVYLKKLAEIATLKAAISKDQITKDSHLQTVKQATSMSEQVKDIGRSRKYTKDLKNSLGEVVTALNKVASTFKSVLGVMNFGKLAEAATPLGLLKVGIMEAAEEEEQFHTANMRVLGSMSSLQGMTRSLTKDFPALRKEIGESITELRNVGMTTKDVFNLAPQVAFLNRATGSSMAAIAEATQKLTAATGSTKKATEQIITMHMAAKEFGLTGKDVDSVIRSTGDSAFLLGTRGEKYSKQYERSLLGAAKAAKGLGLNVDETLDIAKRLADPIEASKFVGYNVMGLSLEEQWEHIEAAARRYTSFIEKAPRVQKQAMFREMQQRFGWDYVDVEKKLKQITKIGVEATGPAEKLQKLAKETAETDPNKFMKKGYAESTGLIRESLKAVDKLTSMLQERLKNLKNTIDSLFKRLNNSPFLQSAGEMGIWGGAALSAASSIGGLGLNILNAVASFKILTGGLGKTGAGMGGLATKAGLLRSSIMLVGKAGIWAAGAIAAAFVGWKIGRWISDVSGLTKEAELVGKRIGSMDAKKLKKLNESLWYVPDFAKKFMHDRLDKDVIEGELKSEKAREAMRKKTDKYTDAKLVQEIKALRLRKLNAAKSGKIKDVDKLGLKIMELQNKELDKMTKKRNLPPRKQPKPEIDPYEKKIAELHATMGSKGAEEALKMLMSEGVKGTTKQFDVEYEIAKKYGLRSADVISTLRDVLKYKKPVKDIKPGSLKEKPKAEITGAVPNVKPKVNEVVTSKISKDTAKPIERSDTKEAVEKNTKVNEEMKEKLSTASIDIKEMVSIMRTGVQENYKDLSPPSVQWA